MSRSFVGTETPGPNVSTDFCPHPVFPPVLQLQIFSFNLMHFWCLITNSEGFEIGRRQYHNKLFLFTSEADYYEHEETRRLL